jgi:ribonuclease G
MGAAFIDIGLDRTALLHFRDAVPDFMDREELEDEEFLKEVSNNVYKMGELLEAGQEVMVQVEKEPLGKKGARLTGEIAIPGRYIVYAPNKNYIAISRRITSPKEKHRLRKIVEKIKEKNVGVIVRTNAENKEEEFQREYKELKKTWEDIQKKFQESQAPCCIYDENDLITIIVREIINRNIDSIIIDSKPFMTQLEKRLKEVAPEFIERVKLYAEEAPIFDAFGIENEIAKTFYSRIYLESGGFIVIQQTEALVSIDVNSGRFVDTKNLESTVTITNIDAAKEIARQIRLQDISGMILIDFIYMEKSENRKKVINTFRSEMAKDSSLHKIFDTGPLNLMEMTRKRARGSFLTTFYETCPACRGCGRVPARSSVINAIGRWLHRAGIYHPEDELEIHLNKWVYNYITSHKISFEEEYPFSWKFVIDNDLTFHNFKVISARSQKDITDMYK